ncbi:hypothetical protein LguiB_003038 [Lonicera macranthoides]
MSLLNDFFLCEFIDVLILHEHKKYKKPPNKNSPRASQNSKPALSLIIVKF